MMKGVAVPQIRVNLLQSTVGKILPKVVNSLSAFLSFKEKTFFIGLCLLCFSLKSGGSRDRSFNHRGETGK